MNDIIDKVSFPHEWDIMKMRQCFSFGKGLSITKEDLVEEGVPVISYGQVHSKDNTGTGINEELYRYVPESFLKTSKSCLVQKNDFIFADTSEDYAGVGNCAFIDNNETIFAGYHSIIARPTSSALYPKYLAYLFLTDLWRDQIRANVMGIKVFSITQQLLRDTYICVPPISEQKCIVELLDESCAKLDKIIANLKQQIELLQKYKKALITETVTKGLNKNVEMKDSGILWIGKIPSHWETKRLKYVLASPLQYGANELGDEYNEDYPRYIRITDINDDNKLKDEGKQSLLPKIAKPYLLKDGDVLFARSGATVGKTFYYMDIYGPAAFAGYLIKAETDATKMLPKYMYYTTLGNGYENWKNMVFTQATIQNIGADKYSQYIVTKPPIQEQREIISFLDVECGKIDAVIARKEMQLDLMNKHKKSIIYEYVTGKKQVKEVV